MKVRFAVIAFCLCASMACDGPPAAQQPPWDGLYPAADWYACKDWAINDDDAKFCQTDNATFTWYLQTYSGRAWTQEERDMATLIMSRYNATDLNTQYHTNPVYVGEGETDVVMQIGLASSWHTNTLASAWCEDKQHVFTCDQHYIRIRPEAVSLGVLCHEVGHTVGLVHGVNAAPAQSNFSPLLGCMATGTPTVQGDIPIGPYQVWQINDNY